MIYKEQIKYNCNVHADVYEHGEVVKTIDQSNLLMSRGKGIILEALCNPNPLYGNLTSMVFGDSETLASTGDTLVSFGNYLINNTTGYALDTVNFDNVRLYWQLSESEFNGKTIKTIGLIGSNRTYNYVFNRVNVDPSLYIKKSPYIKITGYWEIYLT